MKRISFNHSGKSTTMIPEQSFYKVKTFILALLAKQTEVTLDELLEKIEEINDPKEMGENLPFYVLKVKQYLELQGIIKITKGIGEDHQQVISLNKQTNRYTKLKIHFGCTSGIAEMLMQSSDGAVHLLPALPEVWKAGSINGLHAKGGFEIVEMQWKDEKVIKVVIKSTRGGNLRLRLPNEMKSANGSVLKQAAHYEFCQIIEIPSPVISPLANVELPNLRPTLLYDIPTKAGKIYKLIEN